MERTVESGKSSIDRFELLFPMKAGQHLNLGFVYPYTDHRSEVDSRGRFLVEGSAATHGILMVRQLEHGDRRSHLIYAAVRCDAWSLNIGHDMPFDADRLHRL